MSSSPIEIFHRDTFILFFFISESGSSLTVIHTLKPNFGSNMDKHKRWVKNCD